MLWLYTALISAVLFAAVAVLSKEIMEETSSVLFTAIYALLSTIFYTPIFLYYISTVETDIIASLAPFILLSGLANVFGMLSYNYGIKETDISIVMPLNRLQPVFVALIGALVLGEVITLSLGTGIVLVTAGSYLVLLDDKDHPLEPFFNLENDRGAQLSILSAAIFAVAAVTDRFITQSLNPEVYTFLLLLVMTVAINSYMYNKNSRHFTKVKTEIMRRPEIYGITGVLSAGAYYTVLAALSMAEASKVVPILQIQIPLTVVAGGALFSEDHVIQKLLGSAILIIGIIFVAL